MKQTIIILLLGFVLAQDNSLDFTDGYATIPMNGALANLDTYTIEFFSYFTNAGYDEHIHCHIVPRWIGDTNFMPVLGETKVHPEHLKSTYSKLLPHFKDL